MHLIRNTFRYASKKYWDELKGDVKPIYTAPNPVAAQQARDAMFEKWAKKYPAIQKLWVNAWEQFIPFLDYDIEIRKVICSTGAIESLNARFRRSVRARGHFPTEQAALKCLYLTVRSLHPTGKGQVRWTMRWKPAPGAFAIPPPKKREAPPLSPTAGPTRKTTKRKTLLTQFLSISPPA